MKENVKKFMKTNLKWIILFICLIGFLALAEDVFNKEIMNGDIIGYNLVSYLISDSITPIVKFITNLGGTICLVSVAAILFIIIKNKKIGIAIWINLSETYYPKFGYVPAIQYGIKAPFEVSNENFMAIKLNDTDIEIKGTVRYAKEFGI